jgi:nucleotide-binding universal stress UspA family protein
MYSHRRKAAVMLLQDTGQITEPTVGGEHGLRRVLVGFDGSDGAWVALHQAIAVAVGNRATLTVAAVVEVPRCLFAFPGSAIMPYTYAGIRREVASELRRHLAEARDEVPAEIRADTVLLQGRAARELARFAEEGGYDLLVTGPRPTGRLSRLLRRSVTHALLTRSRVSVLAVKA